MQTREIAGWLVSAIGLGGMPMSIEGRPEQQRSIATIHAALDMGVSLIDTADSYCISPGDHGHNERLIAKALASWCGDRDQVMVATKGGHQRPGDGSWTLDCRPEYLRKACEASLERLETDAIDLYQLHRPDPKVPLAESLGALKELQGEGKIRHIGVSNVSVDEISQAAEVVELASVQNELSPRFRSSEAEVAYCSGRGIAFLAWSPLGGISAAKGLGCEQQAFSQVAEAHGVSAQQVALAWELAKAPVVIPIPGSSRPETIRDSVQAVELTLTEEELDRLDG